MSIPIQYAMLCLDCDMISPEATNCPVCASKSVVQLRTWLPPKDQAKSDEIMGKAEHVREAMEKLYGRMQKMMAEVQDGPEPLGVGA